MSTARAAVAQEEALSLTYQGWSGCIVRAKGAAPLVFDPPPRAEIPRGAVLFLTHGHFEHVDGALAHLRRSTRSPFTVIASSPLCDYLERRAGRRDDVFSRVAEGDRIEVEGWRVRVFAWEHMTLLPPGMGNAARYLFKLATHPAGLARMALGGARGPKQHGPMLGFSVLAPGAKSSIVYYGEGVHRRTSRQDLERVLADERDPTLVFGAEPEDLDALPQLLGGAALSRALAFEPHRGWRADFGLPQIDLGELVSRLSKAGVSAGALAAGDTVTLR